MVEIDAFIHDVVSWAATQPGIRAVALVGSHARGAATATSAIDLVLLADSPEQYLAHTGWVERFGVVVKQQMAEHSPGPGRFQVQAALSHSAGPCQSDSRTPNIHPLSTNVITAANF